MKLHSNFKENQMQSLIYLISPNGLHFTFQLFLHCYLDIRNTFGEGVSLILCDDGLPAGFAEHVEA